MPQGPSDIHSLVTTFTTQLTAAVEQSVADRVRLSVAQLLGAPIKRGPGRPPKNGRAMAAASVAVPARRQKKPPLQLCPVPGCKNPAAPIFGMVCAKHKGVPKAKIKKYREARRI